MGLKKDFMILGAMTLFLLAVLVLVSNRPEGVITAWRYEDHVKVEVRRGDYVVTVDVPSKEDVPGILVQFSDKSIQYVPFSPRR